MCKSEEKLSTFVDENGKLRVEGTQLVNEKGKPLVLNGVSFGWHLWHSRFYKEATVEWLATDWQATVVRAAMGVSEADGKLENGYLENPDFATNCVTTIVDAAIKTGIYAIIDFHSHTIQTEAAKKFFTQMAIRYKDAPNVIYEIFNEPWGNMPWPDVKAYSEEIIKTIRAIDPDNIILVGSPSWDQDLHLVAADPIVEQSNIMYTMHFYAATHEKWLRDRCDDAIAKGIPIFVSECAGMEASGDGPINYEAWNDYLTWMTANKISWAAWSLSDKNETCSMLTPEAASEGGWNDYVIKEWGKVVKAALRVEN
jgi:endoglucanase